MLQFDEIENLIKLFRDKNELATFIIYTGYYPNEILDKINKLKKYKNIIIKFGRYIPNDSPRYDDIIGVELASSNQYAEVIS